MSQPARPPGAGWQSRRVPGGHILARLAGTDRKQIRAAAGCAAAAGSGRFLAGGALLSVQLGADQMLLVGDGE